MSIRKVLCGTSSEVWNQAPAVMPLEDQEAVRLRTPLHLSADAERAMFRVLGVSLAGVETLLTLAAERATAERELGRRAGQFAVVRLERWIGTALAGRWQTLAVRIRRERRVRRVRRLKPGGDL
jgi:hypothetical protein